jgi:hypothetical protein
MSYPLRNRQKNFKRWRRQGEACTESGKLPYKIPSLIVGISPIAATTIILIMFLWRLSTMKLSKKFTKFKLIRLLRSAKADRAWNRIVIEHVSIPTTRINEDPRVEWLRRIDNEVIFRAYPQAWFPRIDAKTRCRRPTTVGLRTARQF